MIIILVTVTIAIFLGILVSRIVYLTSPTTGENIISYSEENAVLFVIDMQNDTYNPSIYKDLDEKTANINKSINYAKANNIDIIYIKHESVKFLNSLLTGNKYVAKSEGANIHKDILMESENVFSKSISDAFSVVEMSNYLIEKEISTIYLVGADASACVYKTGLGGINRGYNVYAIEDAILYVYIKNYSKILSKYESKGFKIIDTETFLNNDN